MAKANSHFVCQSCGTSHSKWTGRCDGCGAWNSIVEEAREAPASGAKGQALPKGRAARLVPLEGESANPPRIETGISELDRVAGGGFVPGSAVLIGGDPGIGKSTLLLQALAALARRGERVVYVSGEEAIAQVRLRAQRLGLEKSPVLLAAETNTSDIIATLSEDAVPTIVVIDSIQTLWSPVIEAAPGWTRARCAFRSSPRRSRTLTSSASRSSSSMRSVRRSAALRSFLRSARSVRRSSSLDCVAASPE